MHRARFSLIVASVGFAVFGVGMLLRPSLLAAVGIALTEPAAAVEIRAFYGGLEVGLAVFFGLAVGRPGWHRAALTAQIAVFAGAGLGRVFGLVVGGVLDPLLLLLLALEAAGAGLGLWALRRAPGAP
ncbi:MAG: DUF4345 family protein [Rubricoccaceae bacterium]|nr:DUF4345 family protein [Rubricoccaceae bacterium]